jgi:hypothetical protein
MGRWRSSRRGRRWNIVNNPDADFIKPGPDFLKPEPDFKKPGPGFLKCVWSTENDHHSCGNKIFKYCGCKESGVQGHILKNTGLYIKTDFIKCAPTHSF